MPAKPKQATRYTPEKKAEVIAFIQDAKNNKVKGPQKVAAAKFGISSVTITNWMKTNKKRRGRKPGSKNTSPARRSSAIKDHNPSDLRRLASLIEEIRELEALVEKLETLRAEAAQISAKILK